MAEDVEAKRTLAERAREAWQEAQQRLQDLRVARARGGERAPTAADLGKARDAVELAEDRARLAAEDAEAYARAEAEEAERNALRAERARVAAIHAEVEAAARELHEAAEHVGAALGNLVDLANRIAIAESRLNSHFAEGALHTALVMIGAAWPQNIPAHVARPMPFRDAAGRARFPAELVALLASRLPIPPDPDAPAGGIIIHLEETAA